MISIANTRKRQMRTLKVTRYALLLISLVSIILFFSCGDPVGPIGLGWSLLHSLDTDLEIREFAVSPSGDLYFIAYDPAIWYIRDIYKYDGNGLSKEFELYYDEYHFSDIGFINDIIWAVGSKKVGNDYLPLLIINNGSGWEETEIDNEGLLSMHKAYPVSNNEAWLLCSYSESPGYSSLFYYDDGDLTYFSQTNAVIREVGYFKTGKFYVLNYYSKGSFRLAMTEDNGLSWYEEPIELSGSSVYNVTNIRYMEVVIDALYFYCNVNCNDANYHGVLRRTGAPGEGFYDLVFLSPIGPNFRDITDIAFKNNDEGICVGLNTTAVYKDGKWLLEKDVPDSYFMYTNFDLDANSYGYYVLNEWEHKYSILFHQ